MRCSYTLVGNTSASSTSSSSKPLFEWSGRADLNLRASLRDGPLARFYLCASAALRRDGLGVLAVGSKALSRNIHLEVMKEEMVGTGRFELLRTLARRLFARLRCASPRHALGVLVVGSKALLRNLHLQVVKKKWSGRADLNCRPLAPQASALPG